MSDKGIVGYFILRRRWIEEREAKLFPENRRAAKGI